jgi:putative ABC transport system substrate-binding protein
MPIRKQLQWHQRFLPEAKRVGVLYNPQSNQQWVDQASKIADKLGLEIVAVSVATPRDITSALKSLNNRVDSILAIPDKMVYSSNTAKTVLLFSFRNRIPFIGLSGAWVKAGALYALDWDYSDLGRQSANTALKILNGTKPEKIKPDVPAKSVYEVNLKTAKHMKLKINRKLIAAAEKVYE